MSRYLTPVQRVPGYLPYRRAVGRNPGPVPNQAQMFWPQGQLQPNFLPAGGPSFVPLSYHDGTAELILQNEVEPGIEEEYAGAEAEDNTVTFSRGQYLMLVAALLGGGYMFRYMQENFKE